MLSSERKILVMYSMFLDPDVKQCTLVSVLQTMVKWFLLLHVWRLRFYRVIYHVPQDSDHSFVAIKICVSCRVENSDKLFTNSVVLLEAISFICELAASAPRQTSIHFSSVNLRSWSSFCLVCMLRTPNTILSLRSGSCTVPKLQVFPKFPKAVI